MINQSISGATIRNLIENYDKKTEELDDKMTEQLIEELEEDDEPFEDDFEEPEFESIYGRNEPSEEDDESLEDDFDEEDDEENHHQEEITGVLIDVKNTGKASIQTIRNELPEYYRILDCSCFDIVSVKIGEHFYDIYCDDESLLKENPIVSAVTPFCEPQLTGNLFVTKTDFDGETLSLEPHEIKEVMDHVKGFFDLASGKTHDVLICEL